MPKLLGVPISEQWHRRRYRGPTNPKPSVLRNGHAAANTEAVPAYRKTHRGYTPIANA